MSGQGAQSPRKDAVANRLALVTAARELFSERGFAVSLEEIAARAGVSRTTLHRNFSSREHLAAVVITDNIEQIETRAAELEGQSNGFRDLLDFIYDLQLRTQVLLPILERGDHDLIGRLHDRTARALATLIAEGLARGEVRAEVTVDTVMLCIQMVSATVATHGPAERLLVQQRARALVDPNLFTDD